MKRTLLSISYRLIRKVAKFFIFIKQGKQRDLETVVNWGKTRATKLMSSSHRDTLTKFPISPKLKVRLYDLEFASPITFSAYESHFPLLHMFMNLGIGGGCLKTMMAHERPGNARPRIQEVTVDGKQGLVNAMGLPGPGVETFCKELLMSGLLNYERPLGLSLGGESVDEYIESFNAYEKELGHLDYYPFYYEINISCPNTDSGQDLSKNVPLLNNLIESLRKQMSRVISVKISPDQSDDELMQTAKMLTTHEKIMINAGNTQFRSCESIGLKKNDISRGGGGLSGSPLFERTVEMCSLLSSYDIPIIATGGVDSSEKVKALLSKGASLVGMATALAFDPYIIPKVNDELV